MYNEKKGKLEEKEQRKERRTKYTLEQLQEFGGKELKDKNIFICNDSRVFENIGGDSWVLCYEQLLKKKYRCVCLDQNLYYVHMLYAEAFVKTPDKTKNERIVFKDGNCQNISKENILCITQSDLMQLNHRKSWKTEEELLAEGYKGVYDGAYYINKDGVCYARNENMFFTKRSGAKPKCLVSSYDRNGTPLLVSVFMIYATAFIDNPNNYKEVMFKEGSKDFKDIIWTPRVGVMKSPQKQKKINDAYKGYERLDLNKRTVAFIKDRMDGLSYANIGKKYGCSRQYIHQELRQVRLMLGTEGAGAED